MRVVIINGLEDMATLAIVNVATMICHAMVCGVSQIVSRQFATPVPISAFQRGVGGSLAYGFGRIIYSVVDDVCL